MRGFSLLELLLALGITLVVGMIGFQLFRQNERAFRNQNDLSGAQQNARAVIFQINEEIRRAGQGVPVYAQTFDATPTESTSIVMDGSDATHLRIREGYSNVHADVLTSPSTYFLHSPNTISVSDASVFYNAVGSSTPAGQYAYIWGSGTNSCWSWVRASLTTISAASNTITLTPEQIGEECRIASDSVRLTSSATIALEEAVSLYLNGNGIWRSTAADMTNPANPSWNIASEIGRDFDNLMFTYYDVNDNVVQPTTLALRVSVVRIDARIHTTTGLGFSIRGYPTNLRPR